MKNLAFCIVALFLSTFLSIDVWAQCVSPVPGQVSWWRAEGNALDSADANNGSLIGGVTFGPGVCGQAFRFDGISGLVNVPNAANLDGMAQLSIEAWVRFEATPVGKWQWVVSKGLAFGFGTNSYSLWLAGDTLKIDFAVESATALNTVSAADVIVPQHFYHVVGTYDGTMIKLYVDGTFRGQGALSGAVRNTFYPVLLGARSGSGVDGRGDLIAGSLDEVRIYDRALTALEIANAFGRGSLELLIGRVEGFGLPTGTANSLLAKVKAAQGSLAAGDTTAACSELAALIHEASAQSSKKLTAAEANAIIAAAEAIRATLGCP